VIHLAFKLDVSQILIYLLMNKKFLTLFGIIFLFTVLSRGVYLIFNINELVFLFIVGLATSPLVLTFWWGFNPHHHSWNNCLKFGAGYALYIFFSTSSFEEGLVQILGLVLSLVLLKITFIEKIKNWFLNN